MDWFSVKYCFGLVWIGLGERRNWVETVWVLIKWFVEGMVGVYYAESTVLVV